MNELSRPELSNRLLAQVVEASTDFVGVCDLDYYPVYVNNVGLSMVGATLDQAVKVPVPEFFVPEERDFVRHEVLPTALEKGRWRGEVTLQHAKTGRPIPILYNVFRLDDPDTGQPTHLATIIRDLTEEKEHQAQRDALLSELNHRIKNILANMQAVASHTLRHATSLEHFQETFSGRVAAIAHAHDLLFNEPEMGADLAALIERQVCPYADGREGRLNLEGPPVRLTPDMTHGIGLVLHELATNAAKYGSLGSDAGRIDVSWEIDGGGETNCVRLVWREKDGPRVKSPDRIGFGSRLIESMMVHSLKGSADFAFEDRGLVVRLSFARPD